MLESLRQEIPSELQSFKLVSGRNFVMLHAIPNTQQWNSFAFAGIGIVQISLRPILNIFNTNCEIKIFLREQFVKLNRTVLKQEFVVIIMELLKIWTGILVNF